MLISLCLTVLAMPANVTLVMTQLNAISGFNYLPTEWLLKFSFNFSKTEVPFASFKDMSVLSIRLTVYLVSFLIVLLGIGLQSLVFLISWPLRKKFAGVRRFHNMMRKNYYWSGLIRLYIESYFDLCVAT
jgi:hypothetical protein